MGVPACDETVYPETGNNGGRKNEQRLKEPQEWLSW